MVEYGTKKMSAKPFMRPASKAVEARANEIFERYIEKVNEQINGII